METIGGSIPAPHRDRPLGAPLVAVLAAATATCWMQWAVVGFRREILGLFSWKWWLRDQLFYSAAGYLMLFTVFSLLPILLHERWPRRYSFAALTATLAGLGAFSVLMIFEGISWVAWALVAAGLAGRLHQLMASHPDATWRWVRRIALLGNLAVVVVGTVTRVERHAGENRAMRGLPAASPQAMNVLLIIMDTERAQSMSLYGGPDRTTPHQVALGRRGVVFDRAWSTSSWTLPSHASMFTGRYPSQTTANFLSPLDSAHPTLAEVLRDHGYATAGFIGNVNFAHYHTGLARGFTHYEGAQWTIRQMLLGSTLMQSGSIQRALDSWDRSHWIAGTVRTAFRPLMLKQLESYPKTDPPRAGHVAARFLEWLPKAQGRPFFAFLNFFDAHDLVNPPAPYRVMFDTAATAYGRYLGAIRYMDDTVDSLLRELDRRGVLNQTLVVIASDHGELWGEHRLVGHGNGLYRPLLHVPLLIVNAPGAVPGSRVQQNVSLRDLAATILDLVAVPNQAGLGGTSLRPLLAGARSLPGASPVFAELSPGTNVRSLKVVKSEMKSLIDDSTHIIASAAGELELFGWPADTAELTDLATSPAVRQEALGRLHQVMNQLGITLDSRGANAPAVSARATPGTTPPSHPGHPRS